MTTDSLGINNPYLGNQQYWNDPIWQQYYNSQNVADNTSVNSIPNTIFQGQQQTTGATQATGATGVPGTTSAANTTSLKKPTEKKGSWFPAFALTATTVGIAGAAFLISRGKKAGATNLLESLKAGWKAVFSKSNKPEIYLHKESSNEFVQIKNVKKNIVKDENDAKKLGISTSNDDITEKIKKITIKHGNEPKDNIITAKWNKNTKTWDVVDARALEDDGKYHWFDYSKDSIDKDFKDKVNGLLNNNNKKGRIYTKYKNIDGTSAVKTEGKITIKDKTIGDKTIEKFIAVTDRYSITKNENDLKKLTGLNDDQKDVLLTLINNRNNLKINHENIVKATFDLKGKTLEIGPEGKILKIGEFEPNSLGYKEFIENNKKQIENTLKNIKNNENYVAKIG